MLSQIAIYSKTWPRSLLFIQMKNFQKFVKRLIKWLSAKLALPTHSVSSLMNKRMFFIIIIWYTYLLYLLLRKILANPVLILKPWSQEKTCFRKTLTVFCFNVFFKKREIKN